MSDFISETVVYLVDKEILPKIQFEWCDHDARGLKVRDPFIRVRIEMGGFVSSWVNADDIISTVQVMKIKRADDVRREQNKLYAASQAVR